MREQQDRLLQERTLQLAKRDSIQKMLEQQDRPFQEFKQQLAKRDSAQKMPEQRDRLFQELKQQLAKTPVEGLLPTPPPVEKIAEPLVVDELSRVAEVQFQAQPAKDVLSAQSPRIESIRQLTSQIQPAKDDPSPTAKQQIAIQIAKINYLNAKKTDGFVEALRSARLDLSGLPFTMGDACRIAGERRKEFAKAAKIVREDPWTFYRVRCVPENILSEGQRQTARAARMEEGRLSQEQRETVTAARIAALMQVLHPHRPDKHWEQFSYPSSDAYLDLIEYLTTIEQSDATQALARLAIFSTEQEVQQAALTALTVRPAHDYTEILVQGLNYPWPAVAISAAEAIAKLGRNDLIPQLDALLVGPDPRAPVMKEVNHKRVPVVRELVRLNHNSNCLLCHSPGDSLRDPLTAPIPVPGERLSSGNYIRRSSPPSPGLPDILVRADVTYLRQDFSVLLPVANAAPWPQVQRFDFLVRTRVLTEDEAKEYREKLTPGASDKSSPYRSAALAALSELTGRGANMGPDGPDPK
jgi:hypothetical protein